MARDGHAKDRHRGSLRAGPRKAAVQAQDGGSHGLPWADKADGARLLRRRMARPNDPGRRMGDLRRGCAGVVRLAKLPGSPLYRARYAVPHPRRARERRLGERVVPRVPASGGSRVGVRSSGAPVPRPKAVRSLLVVRRAGVPGTRGRVWLAPLRYLRAVLLPGLRGRSPAGLDRHLR